MHILLVRHGDAVDDAPGLGDAGRWLSGKGRSVTRRVASWLIAREESRPVEIWTSALVRAVQTAEILANAAVVTEHLSVVGDLAPSGRAREVLQRLERHTPEGPIALVGHEPSLSNLAVALLGNVNWPGFKKSGVAAIDWSGHGHGTFRWLLEPKEMHVVTRL